VEFVFEPKPTPSVRCKDIGEPVPCVMARRFVLGAWIAQARNKPYSLFGHVATLPDRGTAFPFRLNRSDATASGYPVDLRWFASGLRLDGLGALPFLAALFRDFFMNLGTMDNHDRDIGIRYMS
jgi:hypothetical protein